MDSARAYSVAIFAPWFSCSPFPLPPAELDATVTFEIEHFLREGWRQMVIGSLKFFVISRNLDSGKLRKTQQTPAVVSAEVESCRVVETSKTQSQQQQQQQLATLPTPSKTITVTVERIRLSGAGLEPWNAE